MPDLTIDGMADAFAEIERYPLAVEVMIVAYPEGTWLLRLGKEPVLLGEEEDFDRIWQEALLGHA